MSERGDERPERAERMTTLFLEDKTGRWPIPVDWLRSLRSRRFQHEGRSFDAAEELADGTWVYRTSEEPPPEAKGIPIRLERGVGRCFVADMEIREHVDQLEYQDATYRRKGMGADGRVVYWHG